MNAGSAGHLDVSKWAGAELPQELCSVIQQLYHEAKTSITAKVAARKAKEAKSKGKEVVADVYECWEPKGQPMSKVCTSTHTRQGDNHHQQQQQQVLCVHRCYK